MNLPMVSRFEAKSGAVSVTWVDQRVSLDWGKEQGQRDSGQRILRMSGRLMDVDVCDPVLQVLE